MAEIVQGLFGVSPESLNAQREQALQAQALQYAQLDPNQQAQMGFYQAGSRLGTGLAGMMGAQDPEMQRVTQRQQMLKNINPNDHESLKQGIQAAMQGGDYQLASTLNTQYQAATKAALDARKTEAEISTKVGERSTNEMKNAAARADASGAVRGTPEWNEEYKTILEEQTTKAEKTMSYGPQAEIASKAFYGKSFNSLTQQQAAVVDAELEKRGIKKAESGASKINTELKIPPNIVGAVDSFDKATEAAQNTLKGAIMAKQLINEAGASNNSQTWEAARTTIAKAVGENKLSNEDIKRTGADPRLVQGALDWVNKKVSGVPNQDIMKQLYVLASVLENSATQQINTKADRARAAAKEAGFTGDSDIYFPRVGKASAGKGTDADKEARYQAWKLKQQGN
jgi:hypothetical protein